MSVGNEVGESVGATVARVKEISEIPHPSGWSPVAGVPMGAISNRTVKGLPAPFEEWGTLINTSS